MRPEEEESADSSPIIPVGRIIKPHGIRGEAVVDLLTDSGSIFTPDSVHVFHSPRGERAKELRVMSARPHKGRLLVFFEGIKSPEEVDALRGWEARLPASELEELDEGDYYVYQLRGLEVLDTLGHSRGHVKEVLFGAAQVLIVIETAKGSEVMIPYVDEFVGEVNLEQKTIQINPPRGIFGEEA